MTDRDRKLIFQLAAQLTGAALNGDLRQESLVANVQRRIEASGLNTLTEYLRLVEQNDEERAQLVSSLTIHTTSWFRENPHFVVFQEYVLLALKRNEVFRVWCAACSTGEEVYSFALMLEEFRTIYPTFEYEVLGTDVDPVSVEAAIAAIYPEKNTNFHLARYKHHLLEGSGPTQGYFTLSKAIRLRCKFKVADLRQVEARVSGLFHVVVCRNVLIYFDFETINGIVSQLVAKLKAGGRLLLGHSEVIVPQQFGLTQEGHSVYAKLKALAPIEPNKSVRRQGRPRILAIDDSLLTRKYLEKTLHEWGFEPIVVGSASEATHYLNFNDVDLITLDLNMPDINGEKWLEAERRDGLKTPVVILSEAHTNEVPAVVRLLALGAQDYVEKSRLAAQPVMVKELFNDLIRTATLPLHSHATNQQTLLPKKTPEVILIGASTGGPQALTKLLTLMPSDCPPIVITQHISAKFAKPLAERLSEISGLRLGLSEDMTPLKPGHLYMSFGDYHIGIDTVDKQMVLQTSTAPVYHGHRPSVDFLFNSAVGIKRSILAMLLTGMGRDGALGLRFLHQEGAFCVAQSEEDCVVYGMPREAVERGAADFVGSIDEIRALVLTSLHLNKKLAG